MNVMMLLVMVMGNLISKEGDVCEEVKKSVDCIVLRTGRRHVPDFFNNFFWDTFLIKS